MKKRAWCVRKTIYHCIDDHAPNKLLELGDKIFLKVLFFHSIAWTEMPAHKISDFRMPLCGLKTSRSYRLLLPHTCIEIAHKTFRLSYAASWLTHLETYFIYTRKISPKVSWNDWVSNTSTSSSLKWNMQWRISSVLTQTCLALIVKSMWNWIRETVK